MSTNNSESPRALSQEVYIPVHHPVSTSIFSCARRYILVILRYFETPILVAFITRYPLLSNLYAEGPILLQYCPRPRCQTIPGAGARSNHPPLLLKDGAGKNIMPTSSTELQHIQRPWCQLTSEISFVPATPQLAGPSLLSRVPCEVCVTASRRIKGIFVLLNKKKERHEHRLSPPGSSFQPWSSHRWPFSRDGYSGC
jgi:hypothetical protein